MLKKILTFIVILVLSVSIIGCSGGSKIVKPYKYNENLKTYNIADVIAAENSKYQLSWDSDNRRILLVDKADGYVWSTIPQEFLDNENTKDMTSGVQSKMLSSITIDCVSRETYQLRTCYGYKAIQSGDFSVSQIENGIRVTYIFREERISLQVQYLLFEDGLQVKVDPTKVAEDGTEYFIHTISIAPFMCSSPNMTDDAYLLYPSGSGALVYMNKEDDISVSYTSEVFGRDGMSDLKTWAEESNEEVVRLPVYGSKVGNSGMFAIIDSNAEAASIVLDAFNSRAGYSTVYSEFALRGETNVSNKFLQSIDNSMKYADALTLDEISVSFYPLRNEDASYIKMAEIYRDYLVDDGLTKKPASNDLTVKFLGGAMVNSSFLGVPTTSFYATTTLKEAEEIAKEIIGFTGSKLNIDLVGYGKTGMNVSEIGGGFTVASKLGGKSGLKNFYKNLKSSGNNVFFDFDIIGIQKSTLAYSAKSDVAVTTTKQRFGKVRYRLATDNDGGIEFFYISRNELLGVADKMLKSVKSLGIDSVALDSLSNISYSDYNYQQYFSKAGMSKDVTSILKKCNDNNLTVMAHNANSYAAMYANVIVDVPVESSKHDAFQYDIPFYQLVFSGYVSMFAPSLNLSQDADDLLLRSIESGVGVSYTLAKNYTTRLKSVLDIYHAVSYDGIKNDIKSTYDKTSDYFESIKGASISEHEILSNGLRKTVFSNGVTVYVNYGELSVETPLGTVESNSFVYSKI